MGTILQNRITGKFKRLAGTAIGLLILREIKDDRTLGDGIIFVPIWLANIIYKTRDDLVAPFFGKLHERGENEY